MVINLLIVIMALPVPYYGTNSPCQACVERDDPHGVMSWSGIIRHFPGNRAVTLNEMILWLRRMAGARTTCSACARLVNLLAIEFATIVSNIPVPGMGGQGGAG